MRYRDKIQRYLNLLTRSIHSNFPNRLSFDSATKERHTFGMPALHASGYARPCSFIGLRYHGVYDARCLFTRRRCLLLRRLFYLPVDTTSSLAPRTRTSLPFSFAFIKYKQFHTFCPTPERPAEHIFTTRHSGFCQLSSAPAPHHFADSPL